MTSVLCVCVCARAHDIIIAFSQTRRNDIILNIEYKNLYNNNTAYLLCGVYLVQENTRCHLRAQTFQTRAPTYIVLYYIVRTYQSRAAELTKGFTADTGNSINKYKTFRP